MNEIVAHFVITVAAILAIQGIDIAGSLIGVGGKPLFETGVTLSDWLFDLDVLAATGIIGVGIVKALRALWRS